MNGLTALKINSQNFLGEVFNLTMLKTVIASVLVWLSSLFNETNEKLFIWLMLFIFIDTFTWWLNAKRNNRINSWEFSRIITKVISYLTAFFVISYTESYIFWQELYLSTMLLTIMLFTEFLSIMENLKLLWVPIPNFIVNEILKKIKYKPIQDLLISTETRTKYVKEFDSIQELVIRIQDVNKLKIANTLIWVFKNSAIQIVDSNFYDLDISWNKLKLFTILDISDRQVLDTLSKQAVDEVLFNKFLESNKRLLQELKDDLNRLLDKDIDWELKNVVLKEIWLYLYESINDISKL